MTMKKSEPVPNAISLAFVEALYTDWLRDPNAVDAEWRRYFEGFRRDGFEPNPQLGPSFRAPGLFNAGNGNGRALRADASIAPPRGVELRPAPRPPSIRPAEDQRRARPSGISDEAVRQDRVDQLVRAYRVRGHMIAKIDPLGLPRPHWAELDPEFYGLSEADLDHRFSSRTVAGASVLTLRELIQRLRAAYCGSIGVQFMHIDDPETKNWLQNRLEDVDSWPRLDRDEKLAILRKLTDAVIFEEFIQKKFLGAKSFSLEGSESLIPLLVFAIGRAAEH